MHFKKARVVGNVDTNEHQQTVEGDGGGEELTLACAQALGQCGWGTAPSGDGKCSSHPPHSQDLLCWLQGIPSPDFAFCFLRDVSVSRV